MNCHIVEPTATHRRTIIFLHGRGSNATEFADEIFESQASDDRTLPEILSDARWIFPDAGVLRESRYPDCQISQWFDMWSVEPPNARPKLLVEGLRRSMARLRDIVRREANIVSVENVLLGGISQGGATAVMTALYGQVEIGGLIVLNSWLPTCISGPDDSPFPPSGDDQSQGTTPPQKTFPVLLEHCQDDHVVPVERGQELRDGLGGKGFQVEWIVYASGGHWLNEPRGVDDLVGFVYRSTPRRLSDTIKPAGKDTADTRD